MKRFISLRAGLLPACLLLLSASGCDSPVPQATVLPGPDVPSTPSTPGEPGTPDPGPGAAAEPDALYAFPGERGEREDVLLTLDGREVSLSVERIHGHAVLEGDILLAVPPPSLPGQQEQELRAAPITDTVTQQRWPGGVVPYLIDPALPNPQRVYDAIAHWQQLTALRFVARTTETRYVTFVDGSGCASYVGMQNFAPQPVTLNAACSTGSAIHEIGHAVGLWHEQSRADRDTQVRVLWENVTLGYESNFRTYVENGLPGQDLGAYDINSVMQYGSYAFSNDAEGTALLPTLVRASDGTTFSAQRKGLSSGDITAIDALYQGLAPSTGRTVIVKGMTGSWTDNGRLEKPRDLSTVSLSVLVPDGAGGYGLRSGAYAGDGAWVARNIPTGTYLLKFNTDYTSTTESVVDVGTAVLGRPDTVQAVGPQALADGGTLPGTFLQLHVDNLAPAADTGPFQLFSANAGAAELNLESYLSVDYPSGTPVVDAEVPYYYMDVHPLIDASRGDRAYFSQFAPRTFTLPGGGTEVFSSLERAAYLPAFTLVNNGTTSVSASLTTPPEAYARFTWKRSAFAALASQVAPLGVYSTSQSMGIYAQPYTLDDGQFSWTPDVVVYSHSGTASPDVTRSVPFRNPYPASWPLVGSASQSFTVSYPLPNNGRTLVSGQVYMRDAFSAYTASPVEPRVTPPRNVTVDGTSAGTEALISSRPVVQWSAPDKGTPSAYTVWVYDVTAAAKVIASLRTKSTQVTLPSGLLTSGKRYAFRVRSILSPGVDPTKAPYRSSNTYAYADMFTAAKTVP